MGLNANPMGHRNAWWASHVTTSISRAPISVVVQRFHLQGAQVLLPQPLFLPSFHAPPQVAAEAAQQHNEPPYKPEASKAGEESVGAVGHHHLHCWEMAKGPRGLAGFEVNDLLLQWMETQTLSDLLPQAGTGLVSPMNLSLLRVFPSHSHWDHKSPLHFLFTYRVTVFKYSAGYFLKPCYIICTLSSRPMGLQARWQLLLLGPLLVTQPPAHFPQQLPRNQFTRCKGKIGPFTKKGEGLLLKVPSGERENEGRRFMGPACTLFLECRRSSWTLGVT